MGCFLFYVGQWDDQENWWVHIGLVDEDNGTIYIAALYWAFTTMATVGYGDIVPKNNLERAYIIVSMVLGPSVVRIITCLYV